MTDTPAMINIPNLITPQELLILCRKYKACDEAIKHLESCKTPEDALNHPKAPEWAYWLRRYVPDLPDEVKRMAELKACESLERVYWLRRYVPDLPADVRRMAELKACESPEWAYELRRCVPDLSDEVKRMAELKACESSVWAYELRLNVDGLHPDTIARLAELGVR